MSGFDNGGLVQLPFSISVLHRLHFRHEAGLLVADLASFSFHAFSSRHFFKPAVEMNLPPFPKRSCC